MMDKYEERVLVWYVSNLLQDKNIYRYLNSNFWEWATENSLLFGFAEETKIEEFRTIARRRVGDSENVSAKQKSGAALLRDAADKRLQSLQPQGSGSLEQTIQAVAELFKLAQNETEFFAFLVRNKKYGYLKELVNILTGGRRCNFGTLDYMDLCSRMTGLTEKAVVAAGSKKGRLAQCCLIEYESYPDRFEVNRRLNHLVNQSAQLKTKADVKAYLIGPVQKAELKWEEFNHLDRDRELLAKIVDKAVLSREKGINILFYGKSGAGKTEFCKTLAERLKLSLYAVADMDKNNDEPSRMERMQSLRMLQSLFAGETGNCILLDEAEDIFGNDSHAKIHSKVYMNRQLEANPTPVFWLTNSIRSIDPAYMRRMTYCLEFSGLPADIQVKMAVKECEKQNLTVVPEVIAGITAEFAPSPALFSSAVRAARLADGGEVEIRNVIEHMDKLLGGKKTVAQPIEPNREFSLELLNTDMNLEKIAAAVKQKGSMNVSFLLYGHPGSGKTEYARWLAAQLGMRILIRRVSDLYDKYVGAAEKNIAAAFAEAQERKLLLVFDEADSLLHTRREARTSWEVSHVNEMLTWMERHPYPFVCTTNFCEKLDEAAFRRFTFKVRFDYLTKPQIRSAFQTFFDMQAPKEVLLISNLTPSDFAVVKRKLEYMEKTDARELVDMLRQEVSVKMSSTSLKMIGFMTEQG